MEEFTLSVSPELDQVLNDLARQEGKDLSDILAQAILLYHSLFQAHQQGKRVGVAAEGDRLETEVVGF